VLTNRKTQVEEEDASGDFTQESSSRAIEPRREWTLDVARWRDRVRTVSARGREHPLIYRASVAVTGGLEHRWMATSEGTRLQTARELYRVLLVAETKAEDGMELSQSFIFDAATVAGLPTEEAMTEAFDRIITQVLALRRAPLVEPFTGPALLRNRASAVFFHEIFGHRIEGHRQKDVEEGQTFARQVGQAVLPDFLSVRDDPTLARFQGTDLRGYYGFDDEGVPAQNTVLVENGVLRGFLMSRSPLEGFPRSNGHGRAEPGRTPVSRMGNLVIEANQTVPVAELRRLLIEECRRQDKPYGLLFEDITGGFTGTRRMSAQSFKVLPVVVYRVFADGRPDELVRGVDVVGTPLTSFSKVIAAGDDPGIFNGTCGAESGNVPVSAISPSILVSQLEVEKRRREQDRPPILPSPLAAQSPTVGERE
jgi:predicted Zn-dependent protease